MWKTSIVAVLLGTSLLANAQQPAQQPAQQTAQQPAQQSPQPGTQQSAPQSAQQRPAQQVVQWQLQVMRDGQQIDAFDGTTTVGQARTDTHHKMVQHNVGCKDQPGGSIDLARTLTVSPLQADANGVTLSIEAQETFEENAARQTDTGCKLPPQPRKVSASHPGLKVTPGQWASWTIVDKDPNLVYRVRAGLADSTSTAN